MAANSSACGGVAIASESGGALLSKELELQQHETHTCLSMAGRQQIVVFENAGARSRVYFNSRLYCEKAADDCGGLESKRKHYRRSN